jgi:hypothetical protein
VVNDGRHLPHLWLSRLGLLGWATDACSFPCLVIRNPAGMCREAGRWSGDAARRPLVRIEGRTFGGDGALMSADLDPMALVLDPGPRGLIFNENPAMPLSGMVQLACSSMG